MSQSTSKPSVFTNFATAGLGGMIGWCFVHPFNTVAIRLNLASSSGLNSASSAKTSFFSFLQTLIREQGVLSLYAGLEAGLLRQVFYSTSRFGLFEVFRDEMAKHRPTDMASRLAAGVSSGGLAAIIRY
jgi:solute carrier family 25 (mitochondrial oxoglutarate transporter), member 11